MLSSKKYSTRHAILKALYTKRQEAFSHFTNFEKVLEIEYAVSVEELSTITKIKADEIESQLNFLISKEFVEIWLEDENAFYYIKKDGAIAYYDEYYLDQKRKTIREYLTANIAIVTAILAIVITIISFLVDLNAKKNDSENLKNIQLQLDTIKKKINCT